MILEKETVNLNCLITQSVFVPPVILSFSSIPQHPRDVAIMGHFTEMLHPSPDLYKLTKVENRQISAVC